MTRAFIIRPFGKKKDSAGTEIDFELIHCDLIAKALEATDLHGDTTTELVESGNIRADMFALILHADVVICDLTIHNANVFYELGIRHALRKGRTILIRGRPTSDGTPFDLATDRYVEYEISNPGGTKDKLIKTIRDTLASDRQTDSPIFLLLPTLQEADPRTAFHVPQTFREEVQRAKAAASKGWLRLLAKDVGPLRFCHEGLRLVAKAQWTIKDYDGAKASWEDVRRNAPNDIDANFALANIYERFYRDTRSKDDLVKSDQALRRAQDQKLSKNHLAELSALLARNIKSECRLSITRDQAITERRKAALRGKLYEAYRHYREAYYHDLNAYYPGINALHLAVILQAMTSERAWTSQFRSNAEADQRKSELERDVASLRVLLPSAIEAAVKREGRNQWVLNTEADLLFLESDDFERVTAAYENAIPREDPFAWDAARGQLELFELLGVRAEIAAKVIQELDNRHQQFKSESLPLQVIMFAGHRFDEPGAQPRFPERMAERAKEMICAKLDSILRPGHRYEAFASAAPGGDILFHEVCRDRGVPSTICLPMPVKYYSAVFNGLDEWKARYLKLLEKLKSVEFSDQRGLPAWLEGSNIDPWERGNHIVLEIAVSRGAKNVDLVVLWDGQPSDKRGGTHHMVTLAQGAWNVVPHRIDTAPLLVDGIGPVAAK